MLSIIGFILTISILVFIHEFGHYCTARFFGVKIEEFSIGFGKELLGITDRYGVRWKICLLPFGGYVKIYGYDRDTLEKTGIAIQRELAFFTKSCFARFCIVAAGPLINYLLAIIIFAGAYLISGKMELPPVIGEVVLDSPAAKADLRENDVIVRVNDKIINSFSDLQNIILINLENPLELLIKRNGELITVSVTPEISSEDNSAVKRSRIGIVAKNTPITVKMNVFSSIYQSWSVVWDISVLTLKSLGQMIEGKRSIDEIGGPLAIARQSGQSLSQGLFDYILFIAMLSINLGLLNLLPIPVLDGGHLVLILYEAITGSPLHKKVRDILLRIGVGIIIFLIVISLSNDIKNLKYYFVN